MKIIVLGAGVIGVTTAYFLARDGHEVTVIDKEPGSAEECSFANGGQLSYSHMEPWATPAALPKIMQWLGKKDAPLIFRMRADYAMWQWGMQFLRAATHAQSRETTRQMLGLSLYSREVLHALYAEHPLQFSYQQQGILHIFHYQQALEQEIAQARYQEQFGCSFRVLSREECLQHEPALQNTTQPLVGGIHFPLDEIGNAHDFTVQLAALCQKLGVTFLYNTEIEGFELEGDSINGIHTAQGTLKAERYVMALGAHSVAFGRQLGLKLPIYPMKGYSISIPVEGQEGIPAASITDQTYKIVYSRLGDIIRVAGTAEFAGYDATLNEERITPIIRDVMQLFPQLIHDGNKDHIKKWACLRPSTPHGRPLLGQTPYRNLVINSGHGTLGWTLACGSARIVADIIAGKKPDIEMKGLEAFSSL